jgi:hypothetical protein
MPRTIHLIPSLSKGRRMASARFKWPHQYRQPCRRRRRLVRPLRHAATAAPREKLANPSYAEEAVKELGPFDVANKDSKLDGCR